jgi:hypothetical protein
MALTDDQQFQLELENARNANLMELEARRAKLDAIRLAKETLLENARNQPVDERGVSAEDIIAFAEKLTASVNG